MPAPALTTRCGPGSSGGPPSGSERGASAGGLWPPRVRRALPTPPALDCPHGLVESKRTTASRGAARAGPGGEAREVRVGLDQTRHHGAAAQVDGRRQSPGTREEVHLQPSCAKEFLAARSEKQGQPETRTPSPVWFFIDGGQRPGELLRGEKAVTFVLWKRSGACGGVVAGADAAGCERG